MAARARELFYMVRIGNYATRPLRQIEGDFRRLGAASDAATARLERLEAQQQRLAARRARLIQRVMDPSAGISLEQRRQKLLMQGMGITQKQSGLLQKQAALEKSLFDNTTARMQAEVNLARAKARVVAMTEAEASAEALALAQQQQTIAERRLSSVGMARGGLQARYGNLAAEAKTLQMQIKILEGEFSKLTIVEAANEAKTVDLIRELRALGIQYNLVSKEAAEAAAAMQMQRMERMQQATRVLRDISRAAQYASGIVVAAFGFMAKAAADFQTQTQLAGTQLGTTTRGMARAGEDIRRGILKQMGQFPAASKDMSDAAYDIYSSLQFAGNQTQRTAKGMGVLTAANKVAVAGMLSVQDATSAVVIMLNTFARASKNGTVDTRTLGDMLNTAAAAVEYGRMSWQEFTQALVQTAPAAKAANQSFTEMSGGLAFLTTRIPNVRNAAVAYARLLELIGRSSKGLHKQGIEVRNATGKFRPLSTIITEIVQKNPKLAQGRRGIEDYFKTITKGAGAGTIGTIQARRAFVFLVQQLDRYKRTLGLVRKSQGQFAESYAIMRKTAGVRWDIAMNRLRKLALEIGATVIPIFERMLEPVQRAIKWFNNLDEATKEHITTFAAWAAIGTLIVSTIGVIASSIGGLIITMSGLGEIGLFAGLAAAAPEILIAAAAITALIVAMRDIPGATGYVKGIASAFAQANFEAIAQSMRNVVGVIRAIVKVLQFLAGHADTVRDKLQVVADKLSILRNYGPINLLITISFAIGKGASAIANYLKKIPGAKQAASAIEFLVKNTGPQGYLYRGGQVLKAIAGVGGERGRQGGRFGDLTEEQYKALENRLSGKFKISPVGYDESGRRIRTGRRQTFLERARGAWAMRQRMRTGAALTPAQQQVVHNKEVQKYIKLLVAAEREVKKHPKSYEAALKLERLRDKVNAKFTANEASAINSAADAYVNADKKKLKSAKDTAKKMAEANKQAIDQMASQYNELLQANKTAFGDITQQPLVQNMMQFGVTPTFRDFMGDITSQITKFSDWRKEIAQGQRVLPKKLLEDIQAAGIEAEPFLAGLLDLTPKQRAAYVAQWKKAQALIKKATDADFRQKLRAWHGHGRKAALAFLNGMSSEQSVINRRMKKMFTEWMKDIGAPTTPPRGGRHGHRKTKTAAAPPARRGTRKTAATHVTHNHNNNSIHVHNVKEDLSTSLRKAQMAQKRKARRLHII